MFLSRLLLNSRSPDLRRDLGNVHDMHRRVLTAFPDIESGAGARRLYETLYRLEASPRGDFSLLVQSGAEPNWSRLPQDYLLNSFEPNPATTEIGPLVAKLQREQRLRFRLRANATKRLRSEGGKRGARIELVGTERMLSWLNRKAATTGFALARRGAGENISDLDRYRVRVTEEPKIRGLRHGALLTFGSTLFEGELVVTDPELFTVTLKRGIGSAKAYGFGLLSVAPV